MRKGVVLAASSYVAWGLFPAYFRLLRTVSPGEVLAHRMIWSLVFLCFVLAFRRQWSWLRPLTRQPRLVVGFAVSAALLSGNWFLYIWAINSGHVIDASLGYFINPLVNIVLGFLLLQERLRPAQWFAVTIAALGVLWLTWQGHHFPWIAIVLALTFGVYGLMRKVAALGPLEGLSLETLLLFPLAAAYLTWTVFMGNNAFVHADFALRLVVMAAGPTRTTKIPGKIKSTSGKISLTAVLAAFSSAN